MMCDEFERVILIALRHRAAIGNPNTFPIDVDGFGAHLTQLFFRTRSREQRPVQERNRVATRRVGNQSWKHARVFVVHIVESDAFVRAKRRKPYSAPMKQILRDSDRDSRTSARKRRVGHDIAAPRLDISDARILASPPSL